MKIATRPAAAAGLQRARVATALTFAFNGFIWAAWVPHIPEIKASLHLSDGALGLALLGPGIGSILTMPLVGKALARWNSAVVTSVMAFATYLVLAGPGLAGNLGTLFGALVLWGVATGCLDVSMNAQAVEVEKAYGRPIMSSFHAWWSIGTVAGTGVGILGATAGLSLARQQAGIAVIAALVTIWSVRQFIPDHPAQEYVEGGRVFEFRLLLLGLAGVCALLAEGSAGDWSPIYLHDNLHVSTGHAGLAYQTFTVTMTIGRLLGDRVVHRLGRMRSIGLLAAVGAAGLALGLSAHTTVTALLGFAALGLGLSVMVPVFFSTAADGPGAAGPKLAVVSSFSYAGFLLGPALIGQLANATGIYAAIWLLPLFAGLAGVLGVIAVLMTSRVMARPAPPAVPVA
ncbi:MAG TPA: MFS transporter [Jatrophihabitans sp.]|nr:MFS transporter [Jatrophihabitans sp.]